MVRYGIVVHMTQRLGTPVTYRIAAKNYSVCFNGREVSVSYLNVWGGWVARATWTSDLYSDPLPTKRQAVAVASEMLGAVV